MLNDEPQILIRRPEVERITALSRSGIYKLMSQNAFPKPIPLGRVSVAWIQSEVEGWVHARIAEFRNASEMA